LPGATLRGDVTFDPNQSLPQEEVDEIVREAIENNEVVLFMKGTPMMPQCGYSDKALKLLGAHREEFETVDVLQSLDEFRVALERHSGWETIPQVFVDGEFVGGSDVLGQLHEEGDLAATLTV
jgi:monothiol glutaredoxin